MSTPVLSRAAVTSTPILDVLTERWSPRGFDNSAPIDEQKLAAALEAARWAPSAFNAQPWRFLVARRGSKLHTGLVDALSGFNQEWASAASALVVAIAEATDAEGRELPFAQYDLGQAVAHLSVQAHADGLFVHQMAGFDRAAVATVAGLEERFVPLTITALGEQGSVEGLSEVLQEREIAPRVRRALGETVMLDD